MKLQGKLTIVRPATPGEIGLSAWHLELEGLHLVTASAVSGEWLAVLDGERCVGSICLYSGHAPPHVLGLAAIVFFPEDRRKHLMSDAVVAVIRNLKLGSARRLEACPAADNLAACRGLQNLGFHKEGTMRGWYNRPGGLCDAVMYSIDLEEWRVDHTVEEFRKETA